MANRLKKGNPGSIVSPAAAEGVPLRRELIVVAKRDVGLRATKEGD